MALCCSPAPMAAASMPGASRPPLSPSFAPVRGIAQARLAFSDAERLSRSGPALAAAGRDAFIDRMRIGLQVGAQVTFASRFVEPPAATFVNQAFCSALSVGYDAQPAAMWAALATAVLDAAYEATASRRPRGRPCGHVQRYRVADLSRRRGVWQRTPLDRRSGRPGTTARWGREPRRPHRARPRHRPQPPSGNRHRLNATLPTGTISSAWARADRSAPGFHRDR